MSTISKAIISGTELKLAIIFTGVDGDHISSLQIMEQ